MDTSELYIRMCCHWKVQVQAPDDWDCRDSLEWHADVEANYKTVDGRTVLNRMWLPRLDQLAKMIEGDYEIHKDGDNKFYVAYIRPHHWETTQYAPTIEQAALKAYMAQQGYEWADKKWRAE